MEKKRYVCEFCDLDTTNYPGFCAHKKSCQTVKDNWNEILLRYQGGEGIRNLIMSYGINLKILKRLFNKNEIHMRTLSESLIGKSHPHTDETKFLMSEKRKKYINQNPDKHPWKKSDKFKSVPCEKFKCVLDELGVKYIPEMSVGGERFYSVDVAIPHLKIVIEINGNQHYSRDGSLKDYYKQRHDYISNLGWKVFELHYSICFDREIIEKTIKNIVGGSEVFGFDYGKFVEEKIEKSQRNICICGGKKHQNAKRCKKCDTDFRRNGSKEKTPSL